MTSVSVAMATYNGARFIREQLESIAAQTWPPDQLVVTDDASTDNTLEIVRRFAETTRIPVVIHQNAERLGYRANFMKNTSMCASEIIALCDQDDVWLPEKLEVSVAALSDPSVLLCHHESWITDDAGTRIGLAGLYPLDQKAPPLSLFPMRNPFGFSMLFRRELLRFSDLWRGSVDNLFCERMAHDQWFFFLASALGTTSYIREPLASYRQHPESTYGAPRSSERFLGRLGAWIQSAASEHASFSKAAEARSSILSEMQPRLNAEQLALARIAAVGYHDLARHCAQRSATYGSPQASERLAAWRKALVDGAYGKRTLWSFGRKAALKDLLFASLPIRVRGAFPTP